MLQILTILIASSVDEQRAASLSVLLGQLLINQAGKALLRLGPSKCDPIDEESRGSGDTCLHALVGIALDFCPVLPVSQAGVELLFIKLQIARISEQGIPLQRG